jgi:hypothetical protein
VNDPECIDFLKTKGVNINKLYQYDRWKDEMWDTLGEFRVREAFIQKYGFAILTTAAVELIRPYAPLLELGAGSGYWAYELKRAGIDVVATDPRTNGFGWFDEGGTQKKGRWKSEFTQIEKLNGLDAIRKYPNRNLLIVWPSYGDSWAADALEIFTGHVVVYAGEWGDACAESRFFDLLDQRFSDRTEIKMPHFWGLHDRYLTICKKPKQLTTGG